MKLCFTSKLGNELRIPGNQRPLKGAVCCPYTVKSFNCGRQTLQGEAQGQTVPSKGEQGTSTAKMPSRNAWHHLPFPDIIQLPGMCLYLYSSVAPPREFPLRHLIT